MIYLRKILFCFISETEILYLFIDCFICFWFEQNYVVIATDPRIASLIIEWWEASVKTKSNIKFCFLFVYYLWPDFAQQKPLILWESVLELRPDYEFKTLSSFGPFVRQVFEKKYILFKSKEFYLSKGKLKSIF